MIGNRRPFVGVLVLVVLAASSAAVATLTRRGDEPSGDLDDRALARIVRAHVAQMPRSDEGYVEPSAAERQALRDAWTSIADGRIDNARSRLAPHRYTVAVRSGFVAVQGPGGLFVYRDGGSDVVVEVPHPLADVSTENIGVDLFLTTQGRALLVAGAHRDAGGGESADVAHAEDSAFHAVHVAASVGATVVQLHGYADSTVPGVDVVVSRGAEPSPITRQVAERMGSRFRTCLWHSRVGDACNRLSARTNAQGRHLRRAGGEFVHVELARRIRDDDASTGTAVSLLAEALR